MASVCEEIYSIGYPLLYLPMIDDGSRIEQVAQCEYTGTPTFTSVTSSAMPTGGDGDFGEDCADFNGTSSRIELPNFGNLMSSKSVFGFSMWARADAVAVSFKRFFDIRSSGGSLMLGCYVDSSSITISSRATTGEAAETVSTSMNTTYKLITGNIVIIAAGLNIRMGASEAAVTSSVSYAARSIASLTSQSLWIGAQNASAGFFDGLIHNFALYNRTIGEDQHEAIRAATTTGVWCIVDSVASGPFNDSAGSALTGTYKYSLRKDGPQGVLLAKGTDLSVSAGAISKEFYLPAAGSYWLDIYDSTNTEGHGEMVTFKAA